MPKFRVSGDVRHAFVHMIEADSQEEAIEMVEGMNYKDLNDVQIGLSGTAIEAQDIEEIEEDEGRVKTSATQVQMGTVIVFKLGVTKVQAEAAIEKLRELIDESYQYPRGVPRVQTFNPEHGGPVWYVP